MTRRLTLSLALACALTLALAPAVTSRQKDGDKKANAGRLFSVYSGMKKGYIDRTGKLVIEAKYDHAGEFSEGLAFVSHGLIYDGLDKVQPVGNLVPIPMEPDGMKWDIIDESGNVVAKLKTNADYMSCIFSEGLAPFSGDWVSGKGSIYGYMDKTGKTVIEPRFTFAWLFKDGVAPACADWGRCGFIDRTGKFIVRPVYAETRPFSDGLALVKTAEGLAGYVNKSGELVITPQFDGNFGGEFNEGLAPAAYPGTKFGFIDKLGHFRIEPQFDSAGPFSDGLAPVTSGDKMGYVDREGKFVISPRFAGAYPFSEGLAAATTCPGALGAMRPETVAEPCGYGYIDKTGKFVIEERFDGAEPFHDGLAQVYTNDGRGYINREGNFVWKPSR